MSTLLFSPYTLGPLVLKNRIVMAPMTRSRAIGSVPPPFTADYYAQRAAAGLIITEGTSPASDGLGYARIPGLFSQEQIAGWKKVTAAVHDAGGAIFAQLMHCGRVGHPANLPAAARVLAPSALAASGEMYTDAHGPQPYPVPVEMNERDIETALESFAGAARNAIEAGFDGVELHGANGYLIEQFLNTASNQRQDAWGGTVANRARFVLEVARRVSAAIGKERVGIRLSPYGVFNGMEPDQDTDSLYELLARELTVTYIHLVDHASMGAPAPKPELVSKMRKTFVGALILSGGYDTARAEADLTERKGDLIAFGRPFLANPNLVDKLRRNAPLRAPDMATFYTPGEKGYTDWPID
jgi:N-ethylmaleimide reductase